MRRGKRRSHMDKKMLPVGLDSFEKIRRLGYYYMDKTLLIQDVLTNRGDVNLFTRPRRFGKTLNMSMLNCFFSHHFSMDLRLARRSSFARNIRRGIPSFSFRSRAWKG